ncbi:hypothetical protein CGMCC3_g1123 [Colletotrichum fructicola]|nr:uncharacterized protein CGMCC3_g1123 [Colletotrichum fructicola]KAE9582786.1 hypothetical protein CGMCC3_g1123 [Colletotrichum fructicola]
MSQLLKLPFLICLLWGLLAVADLTTHGVAPRAVYTCTVPANNNGTDDSPAILAAFKECRKGRRIVFSNTTYHVNQMMTTTDLEDTQIEIHGTLLVEFFTASFRIVLIWLISGRKWSNDTDYWLSHPQPTGFQNGSAAWFLGGKNVTVHGFGYGTLDGNGQVWQVVYPQLNNMQSD